MDVKNLLGGFFKIKENQDKTVFEVATKIMLFANVPFVFYVEKTNEGLKITDHKLVCTFLSKLFDLSSKDVKGCIQEVLALNRIHIKQAEIFTVVKQENSFDLELSNFLVAVSQLVRMQAFFEKAEN